MSEGGELPVTIESERTWTLSDDRRTVRFHLPPLPIEGMPEPLIIHLDFDAKAIDDTMRRLAALRAQMVPLN